MASGGLMLGLTAAVLTAQQVPRFGERVEVARVIVDVRVIDERGDPILRLSPEDFKVRIDGKLCRVETATWVGGSDSVDPPSALDSPAALPPVLDENTARLIVFVFQKDLERSRIIGLMRMLLKTRDFLGTLAPRDRVAVLSFDSHLRIWTDFTRDRARLKHLLGHDVLLASPPPVQASEPPSLLERLSADGARRAYSIERALERIGEALEPLPGSKALVLVGHGFGRLSASGMSMEPDYDPARRALVAARTSVFSLDVTDADYHSLEAGLQTVAEQTGGFYARTHVFSDQAMRRLAGALAGYYVLFVEKPETGRRTHDVELELTRRKGFVHATSSYAAEGR
jgi:VWFA-related protein